jgi:hypothetical protein
MNYQLSDFFFFFEEIQFSAFQLAMKYPLFFLVELAMKDLDEVPPRPRRGLCRGLMG